MSPSWAWAPTSEQPDVVLDGGDDVVHLPSRGDWSGLLVRRPG